MIRSDDPFRDPILVLSTLAWVPEDIFFLSTAKQDQPGAREPQLLLLDSDGENRAE